MLTADSSVHGDSNSGIVIGGGKGSGTAEIDIVVRHQDATSEPIEPAPWYFAYLRDFATWAYRILLALFGAAGATEVTSIVVYQEAFIKPAVERATSPAEPAAVSCYACDDQEPAVTRTIYTVEARCGDGRLSKSISAQQASLLLASCPTRGVGWDELEQRFFGDATITSERVAVQLGVPEEWSLRDVRAFAVRWTSVEQDPTRYGRCEEAFDEVIRIAGSDRQNAACTRPFDYRIIEAEAVRPLHAIRPTGN